MTAQNYRLRADSGSLNYTICFVPSPHSNKESPESMTERKQLETSTKELTMIQAGLSRTAKAEKVAPEKHCDICKSCETTSELTSNPEDESESESEHSSHYDWIHQCLAEFRGPGIYTSTTCDNRHPSSPGDLFNCSQAECQVCLDLSWTYFPMYFPQYDGLLKKPSPMDEAFRSVKTTLANLEASGSCDCCRIILKAIKQACEWVQGGYPAPFRALSARRVEVIIRIKANEHKTNSTVELIIAKDLLSEFHLELYTEPNVRCPWSSIGPASHVAVRPSVKYCAEFTNTRLADCNALHHNCKELTKPQLPTRVIDVGTITTLPRLFISGGKRANYITLSHCWGNKEHSPLRTTTLSLSRYYDEIPWTELGQTFQDAILITRELGVQFLWIDSLCIIQDSESDWETESARMAEVYLNSLLTLAATASLDGRGGCIIPRLSRTNNGLDETEIDLPSGEQVLLQSRSQEETDVFVRSAMRYSHDIIRMRRGSVETGAALLNRAWVYQETVLSPRTVHFHSEELIWECREGLSCECGHFEFPQRAGSPHGCMVYSPGSWKSPYSSIQLLKNNGVVQREEALQQWYRVIVDYSSLKLTYDADRLPALAGLASYFAEKLDTPYLAGLWLSDLSRGLLWKRSWGVPCRRLSGPGTTIPTWSWASIIPINDAHPHETPSTESPIQCPPQQVDVCITILAATCTIAGIDTFGKVSRGLLQVKGTLVEIPLLEHQGRESPSYYLQFGHQRYNYPLRAKGYNFRDLIFDVVGSQGALEEILPGESLYCLLVGYLENQNGLRTGRENFFLVLRNIRGRTFERVGLLCQNNNGADWFQNAEVAEIEIQ
ncbi:heterokaryon incompatibility protein-domain-containing protein [Tricladium varicosporioides]|nr:heterokaryon incompatibility protein-domain-containing protein [Hymenoscyphus varicosporioides]